MGLNLWDRQQGESDKNFSAFVLYRDLEPSKRSIPAAAKMDPAGRAAATFNIYSEKWNWVERVSAWDDHQDHERQRSMAKVREAQDDAMSKIAAKGLENLATAIENMDLQQLAKPQYFPRVLDTVAKISHLATGSKAAGEPKKGKSVEDEIRELAKEMEDRPA